MGTGSPCKHGHHLQAELGGISSTSCGFPRWEQGMTGTNNDRYQPTLGGVSRTLTHMQITSKSL